MFTEILREIQKSVFSQTLLFILPVYTNLLSYYMLFRTRTSLTADIYKAVSDWLLQVDFPGTCIISSGIHLFIKNVDASLSSMKSQGWLFSDCSS